MPRRTSRDSLERLGEFGFIERLKRRVGRGRPPLLRGIGDDAALVQLKDGRILILTVDLLIERVHFDRSTSRMEDVGYKAAIANFSDVAAMGGTPQYALVALATPPWTRLDDLKTFYSGLLRACRRYGVQLVGGDTSASPREVFISITVTGIARRGEVLTRDGARKGDLLFVTGTLGDAQAGLELLQAGAHRPRARAGGRTASYTRFLVRRHLRPTARVREARQIAARGLATAAIDLSDGLSGDLQHLCTQSRVGAEIEATALPLSPACRWYADRVRMDPIRLALSGGEDYELLLSVPPRHEPLLLRHARRAGFRLTRIGVIKPRDFGICLKHVKGPARPLLPVSYQHFKGQRPTRSTA